MQNVTPRLQQIGGSLRPVRYSSLLTSVQVHHDLNLEMNYRRQETVLGLAEKSLEQNVLVPMCSGREQMKN